MPIVPFHRIVDNTLYGAETPAGAADSIWFDLDAPVRAADAPEPPPSDAGAYLPPEIDDEVILFAWRDPGDALF
ncbi:MAG: hypothetical protein ACK5MQ_13060 [Pikeienuella sp.]